MNRMQIKKPLLERLSVVQLIFLYYLVAVALISALLALPISQQDFIELSPLETVFTAVSAVSVTGLTVVSTAETFTVIGQIVLVLAMQVGGLGVMALGTLIWVVLGRKIGFKNRTMIMAEQNTQSLAGIVRLVKEMFSVILLIELVGFLMLGTLFLSYFDTVLEAYYHGFFAAISATTNSGFDITGESFFPFQADYLVQIVTISLIISGAIGFPVLIEIKEYLQIPKKERHIKRFSLFTKLTTLTYFGLLAASVIVLFVLEFNNLFKGMSWHEALFANLFQSTTVRSAGLSTIDVNALTEQTQLFLSSMMFVGASPSSVGGGIRTTTVALVIIFIIQYARGRERIKVFGREIPEEDLRKAVVVTFLATLMIAVSVLIILSVEPFTLTAIIFEVCSAFGTAGLSMGITSDLSTLSKIILMILMFIGRIGILTFLFSLNRNRSKARYRYPEEHINIG